MEHHHASQPILYQRSYISWNRCPIGFLLSRNHQKRLRQRGTHYLPPAERTRAWRISRVSLDAWLGKDVNLEEPDKRSYLYVRVSSKEQDRKGSLKKQTEICRKAIQEHHSDQKIEIISETASAFSFRPKLFNLLKLASEGKVSKVMTQNRNRLCRLPGERKVILGLFSMYGVTVEYLFEEEEDNDRTNFVLELTDFCQFMVSSQAGKISGMRNSLSISGNGADLVRRWDAAGWSKFAILRKLKQRGYYAVNGAGKRKPINRALIYKVLGKGELKRVIPVKKEPNSFDLFRDKHLVEQKGARTYWGKMYRRYRKFCRDNKLEIMTKINQSRYAVRVLRYKVVKGMGGNYYQDLKMIE